jgi:hypothetical protein
MKKKIVYAVLFILLVIAGPSCSKTCKNCKKVYYSGTTRDHEDSATQYCGAELITIEATGSVTVGAYTVKWECN